MAVIEYTFAVENWTITPAPLAVNEVPPTISEQRWVVGLTGVVITNERGGVGIPSDNPHDWRRLTLPHIEPDIDSPMNYAINRYGIPTPTNVEYSTIFTVDQWAPFFAVSSFVDIEASAEGVSVDAWRTSTFGTGAEVNNQPITNGFEGIDVDIAVFGGAILHRISYNIVLVGRIVFGFLLAERSGSRFRRVVRGQ
jgi:hypothetical protein